MTDDLWRGLNCSLSTSFLSVKYERANNHWGTRTREEGDGDGDADDDYGVVYDEDAWKPCIKGTHPVWLMAFRKMAFLVLLYILIRNAIVNRREKAFYYFTEWTFTLVIIYFGFGSLWSIYGCYRYHNDVGGGRSEELDEPQAIGPRQATGFWDYVFQIIFQVVAGAVVLTDCIFWFILVPFLTREHYTTFQSVATHIS